MDEIRGGIETVLGGGIAAPKDIDLGVEADAEISDLIHRIQALTPQQTRVLGMLAEGLLNKQIANEPNVSEATGNRACLCHIAKARRRQPTQAVIRLSNFGGDPLQRWAEKIFHWRRQHLPAALRAMLSRYRKVLSAAE